MLEINRQITGRAFTGNLLGLTMAIRDREFILRSACSLATHLLDYPREKVEPSHLRELLSTLIWKITEADGKYETPYWSEGFLANPEPNFGIHEHVFERKKLILKLLDGTLDPYALPQAALACIVTRDEDARLRQVSADVDGWRRYVSAGIKVWDRRLEKWMDTA